MSETEPAATRACRACGGRIGVITGGRGGRRGGRPRQYCHDCRPSQAARRRARLDRDTDRACVRCGAAIDFTAAHASSRRTRCHGCAPYRPARRPTEIGALATDRALSRTALKVLSRAVELAEAGARSPVTIARLGAELAGLLERAEREQRRVRRSEVDEVLRDAATANLAAAALEDHGQLDDDAVSSMQGWIARSSAVFPVGFAEPIGQWLHELHAGGERVRPRSRSTIYAYFGRVRSHLLVWSQSYGHLREVTEADIRAVLDRLVGHERAGVFTSLRSLFGFAHRHRIVFTDPTRRLHVGRAPKRSVLPMTAGDIAGIQQAAVTPAQRLVVVLVAVYAARATAIRELTLDDLDLARRRIRISGTTQPLSELAHRLLVEWLTHRQRRWPHTPNRHVLISRGTAAGTGPVPDYYLSWNLAMQQTNLEHLRADRVLHEAAAVAGDPLHLAAAFNLSVQTAIDYAEIARSLAERPIEGQTTPP